MLDPAEVLKSDIENQSSQVHLAKAYSALKNILHALEFSSNPEYDASIIIANEIAEARKSAFSSALVTFKANRKP